MKSLSSPTEQTYSELQFAYDWFNQRLFGGELPACLITLQRNKRTMGYYSPDRFVDSQGGRTDEIALNPEYFAIQSIEEVLSTKVHEMVHLWQQHHGKPGRGKYHNQEWADKMLSIGLHPSSTARPGGKTTGDQMDHYIVEGPFLNACRELLATKFQISWYDRYPATQPPKWDGEQSPMGHSQMPNESAPSPDQIHSPAPASVNNSLGLVIRTENSSNRLKYVCPECKAQAWGKPTLNLICGDCNVHLMASLTNIDSNA